MLDKLLKEINEKYKGKTKVMKWDGEVLMISFYDEEIYNYLQVDISSPHKVETLDAYKQWSELTLKKVKELIEIAEHTVEQLKTLEPKYYLRRKNIFGEIYEVEDDWISEPSYLNFDTITQQFELNTKEERGEFKTQFTEHEIQHKIAPKVDLSQFKTIKAEQNIEQSVEGSYS